MIVNEITVKEFIELLKKQNPDAKVYGVDWGNGCIYRMLCIDKMDDKSDDNLYISLI